MRMTAAAIAVCSGLLVLPVGHALAQHQGAVIETDPFDSVELRGGGHVLLRHGDKETVNLLAGSTELTKFRVVGGHKLVIDACNSNCPPRYTLEIEITAPKIDGVAIKGGGHIEAAAGFPSQDSVSAAIDGGGKLDITSLPAQAASAAVRGGGRIDLRAESTLTAAVEGGGSIRYVGNPKVSSAIDGGGSVSPSDGHSD